MTKFMSWIISGCDNMEDNREEETKDLDDSYVFPYLCEEVDWECEYIKDIEVTERDWN